MVTNVAARNVSTDTTSSTSTKRMYLVRLPEILRPCSTANTIVAKLSSDKIIRPAFWAASVPVPMAIPMSAALMAGASLTPSPVMAMTSPCFLSVPASSTLCSGATRPATSMESLRASRSSSGRAAKPAPGMAWPPATTEEPAQAVAGADFIHTDVWVSAGGQRRLDRTSPAACSLSGHRRSHADDAEPRRQVHGLPARLPRTAQFTRTGVRNLRHAGGRMKARRPISGSGG